MNQYTKYISLKKVIENLFGHASWCSLKASNDVKVWRSFLIKTLNALHTSILATVEFSDEEWFAQIDELIAEGKKDLTKQKSIDELISSLAATVLSLSFLQTGFLPQRAGSSTPVSMRKSMWKHNSYRQVIYLQSPEQKERLFWSKQQKKIGFAAQMELQQEHKASGAKTSYSEWCKTQGT